MLKELKTRQDLAILMEKFYDKLLADESISYIFTDVAKINIREHLPVITDFWESILLDHQVYNNNPMKIHMELNKKSPLTDEHFKTWLGYFISTVDELFEGEIAERAKQRAISIANVMRIKIREK